MMPIDWYIARDTNITESYVLKALRGRRSAGGNPAAPLSAVADWGFYNYSRKEQTDIATLLVKKEITWPEALLWVLSKRGTSTAGGHLHPLVMVCLVLVKKASLGMPQHLSYADCKKLFSVMEYEQITDEFVAKLTGRKGGKVGNLDIWFNALRETGLFTGPKWNIALKTDPDVMEFAKHIAANPSAFQDVPSKTDKEEYYHYMGRKETGLPGVLPKDAQWAKGLFPNLLRFTDSAEADIRRDSIMSINYNIALGRDSVAARFAKDLSSVGLRIPDPTVNSFVCALATKPFVILTGLSGSGKTKIAQAFARWICPKYIHPDTLLGEILADHPITREYQVTDNGMGMIGITPKSGKSPITTEIKKANIFRHLASIRSREIYPNRKLKALKKNKELLSDYRSLLIADLMHKRLQKDGAEIGEPHYAVVPVGADWTSSENILGYPDAIHEDRYIRTQALNLILAAENDENKNNPYFLILDEMNLSHVERYFSDFLSAMESRTEQLHLHSGPGKERSGVRQTIKRFPENLFIIGTVNVDETTYLFSPKVLDRANVIEFRASNIEMAEFIKNPGPVHIEDIDANGSQFAKEFISLVKDPGRLGGVSAEAYKKEALLFFDVLSEAYSEFGFRKAHEISRFVAIFEKTSKGKQEEIFRAALDAQVLMKILPKLNGAKKRLQPVLGALACLCYRARTGKMDSYAEIRKEALEIISERKDWLRLQKEETSAGEEKTKVPKTSYLCKAYEKIVRMLNALEMNGYTNYFEG